MDTHFLDSYYQELQRKMVGPKKEKGSFLEGLKDNISVFLDSRPDATPEEIYSIFGTPEALAEEFVASLPESIPVHAKVRNARVVIIVGIIVALIAISLFAFHVADIWSFTHGSQVDSPVTSQEYSADSSAIETH